MMSLESVANDRLRHMRIGDASVSKADGSQTAATVARAGSTAILPARWLREEQ